MKNQDTVLEECVLKLREMVQSDSTIMCPTEKEFLVKFIRARKFNSEAAFQTLRRYYEMRTLYKEEFKIFYPSALQRTLDSGIFTVLKHRDPYGRKILLLRTEPWKAPNYSVDDVFLTALLIGEEMILSKKTQENGTVQIHDLSHLGLSHARQFHIKLIKRIVSILQGAFPAKFKTIHVLNQPYIHTILFSISQPFFSKKFLSRVLLHGTSLSKMQESLPLEILPDLYGGHLSMDEATDHQFMSRLMDKDEYYQGMLKYGFKATK